MQDNIMICRTGVSGTGWALHRTAEYTVPFVRTALVAARLALTATVLPSLADAVAVGDRVRLALLRCSDGHPVFTGRDAAGHVKRGLHHDHAWYLPADDDDDGAIDHVLVYARGGFDLAALRALARLRRVWGHGGPDLTVTLIAVGSPDQLGCLRRDGGHARTPQLGTARIWESLTPFVPPRHIKHRATGVRDAANEQLARLLALHGRPLPRIEPLASEDATTMRSPRIAWQRFRRLRTVGGGSRGSDATFGFRLCFDQPVTGPIALGYAAHQGLGQFVAVA
ncbi:MAG TPA: type I-U CRISPR-associated protein Csb2 [Kofleriaceae bacterium]|jgi:CRISPR-associated protein Csb2|nr:type I-U CRISPR-associated protein Csb2 [Kofleriaceae bacterium]